MTKLKLITGLIALTITCTCVFGQKNTDTGWVKIRIVNGTALCRLYNIQLHYNKGNDSGWVVNVLVRRDEYLSPKDTTDIEVSEQEIAINYYTYDCICGSHVFHKRINEQFVLKTGRINIVTVADFYIPPEWWQTWWFYLALTFSAVFVLWLLIKYYTHTKLKAQKRELEKELALQTERMRISAEMHDDIGAGLCGIKLQSEMLSKKAADPETRKNLIQIHDSIHDISAKVREVIWSLDAENDTLLNLISFIHQQAHRMVDNSNLELRIQSQNNMPDLCINGDKRRNIYLILKEALHNILKHAEATTAKINYMVTENILQIVIEDNGKGFSEARASVESKGLKSMKERVKKLNGNINIVSSASGTSINISIPL